MSFKVMVIPEDPTHNGYILKPLVEAVLAGAGKPQAKVEALVNPRLKGFDHAVRAIRDELPDRYGFWDLWIFLPDADRTSPKAMESLEMDLSKKGVRLLCCAAHPEVEIYACAFYRREIAEPWEQVRTHPRLKEEVFAPLLEKHGDARRAGGGRDLMISASLTNLALLFQLCPELQTLRNRISDLLQPRNACMGRVGSSRGPRRRVERTAVRSSGYGRIRAGRGFSD